MKPEPITPGDRVEILDGRFGRVLKIAQNRSARICLECGEEVTLYSGRYWYSPTEDEIRERAEAVWTGRTLSMKD